MAEYRKGGVYPGAVPQQDGAVLDIDDGGLPHLLVQMRGPSSQELAALSRGPEAYGIYRNGPLLLVLWKFQAPVGILDTPFDARLQSRVRPAGLAAALDVSEGRKNALLYIALNGGVILQQRLIGLQAQAVEQLHAAINQQLETPYSPADFLAAVNKAYANTQEDLWSRSATHRHR